MDCNNGYLYNNTCICNDGYSNEDDFFTNLNNCPINTDMRIILINLLLGIGGFNVLIAGLKIFNSIKNYSVQKIKKRLLYSFISTLLHYTFVVITCVFLQTKKMNDYLGSLITGSLAFSIGCTEQSLHLVEILILYAQSFTIKRKELKANTSIGRLKSCVLIVSMLAGINWFFWSIMSYIYGKKYWYLFSMWIGLSITTFIWGICFLYYGKKTLLEISKALEKYKRDDIKIIIGKLKTVIYLYTFVSFMISGISLSITLIEELYSRTVYIYSIMGFVLGIADSIYIWIINITYDSKVIRIQQNPTIKSGIEISTTGTINKKDKSKKTEEENKQSNPNDLKNKLPNMTDVNQTILLETNNHDRKCNMENNDLAVGSLPKENQKEHVCRFLENTDKTNQKNNTKPETYRTIIINPNEQPDLMTQRSIFAQSINDPTIVFGKNNTKQTNKTPVIAPAQAPEIQSERLKHHNQSDNQTLPKGSSALLKDSLDLKPDTKENEKVHLVGITMSIHIRDGNPQKNDMAKKKLDNDANIFSRVVSVNSNENSVFSANSRSSSKNQKCGKGKKNGAGGEISCEKNSRTTSEERVKRKAQATFPKDWIGSLPQDSPTIRIGVQITR